MTEPDFDRAAEGLRSAAQHGQELPPDLLHVLERVLDGRLRTDFSNLSVDERSDLISEAVLRFVAAAKGARIDPHGSPGGYLWTTARHLAVDLRRRPAAVSLDDVSEVAYVQSDDEIARLVEAEASSALVIEAMRLAALAGDHECARLVSEWMVLAQQIGRAPSLRTAAKALGTSYGSVGRALGRFRQYLESAREEYERE